MVGEQCFGVVAVVRVATWLVTVYVVTGVPLAVAAFHVTRAFPEPDVLAVALTVVGAVGSSDGVASLDAADGGPIPVVLVARTRKV